MARAIGRHQSSKPRADDWLLALNGAFCSRIITRLTTHKNGRD